MNIHLTPEAQFNARAAVEGWPVRCDASLAFEQKKLAALHDVWRAIANGRAAPAKKEFTARSLHHLLGVLTFIDRVTGETGLLRYQFRFFGSSLVLLTGDLTKRHLDEIVPQPHLQSWVLAYDLVLASQKPLRFVSHYQLPVLNRLEAETYAAPLAGDDGETSGLITACIFKTALI